ncbi:TonB-dependent siderophore receptor [Ideonella sp. BN130291]|uniref:TonB-dependent siderophore receptor n=1 Tax=Ideonella sp. BN130291 TaxID=3112940 RepID=UPI002E26A970|nr:TonB-dependent siderophore receptor [Ideonella sp. BN130291]
MSMTPKNFRCTGVHVAAMAAIACVHNAQAQAAGADHEAVPVEQVIISAKKETLYVNRDVNAGALGVQPLHELPFSIGSYSRELIDNQRARTVQDVLKNDPGVQPASFGGAYDGIAVRGFSANALNSVRRDGLPTNVYADIPLEHMERVDVLKGLSGFLYGVGEPSGLVNYILKRPTRRAFTSVDAELRCFGGRYAHVDTSGAIGASGTLAYRVNLAGEKQGDFTHAGDLSRATAGLALDVQLAPGTLLRLDADHQHKKLAAQPVIGPRSDGTVVPADSFNPRTLLGQPWGQYRTDASNVGVRLEQGLGQRWDLIAQLGYSRTERDAAFPDVYEVARDGTITSGDYYYSPDQRFTTVAAQAYLNGHLRAAGVQHDVVIGVSDSRLRTSDGGWFPNDGLTVGNIFAPVYSAQPDFSDPPAKNQGSARQPSLFASDTISLNEHWRVLAGLRTIAYRSESRSASGTQRDYSAQVTVPSAALVWLPNKAVTAYASYTEGLEQGAYAPNAASNRGERLDPIRSQQIETGVKWRPRPALSASLALFHIDKPLQAVDANDGVFKTLGRQRHQGLELALNGELARGLQAVAGVSWLDARVQGTRDAREGKRPANVARLQASAWLDWRVAALPGLSVNGGLVHTGERALDQANSLKVPAFTRWDAGVRYAVQVAGVPSVWRLQVQNLANRRYWENVNYGGVLAGAPRTLRLSGEWLF